MARPRRPIPRLSRRRETTTWTSEPHRGEPRMTAASSPEPAHPPAAPRAPPPAEPAWSFRAIRRESGDYLRRVYKKADQATIFFLAGAIALNVLVAIVPLVLAAVGVASFFLQARSELGADTTARVLEKADHVNTYFLAGAIAFKVLVLIVTHVLAAIGVARFLLQARSELRAGPTAPIIEFLLNVLPQVSDECVP